LPAPIWELRSCVFFSVWPRSCVAWIGAAAFLANLEKEVLRLERQLQDGSYRPGRYKTIEIFDPKHRIVSAAPFPDRVVHHAFCAVCEPLFERGFIGDSYANRTGKGTHRAIARYEKFPFERRRGLPIGNLSSQFFANLYLDGLDHFCKEVLRAKGYLRYVDDFALFHDDPGQLEDWGRSCQTRQYLALAPVHLSGRVV